MSNRNMKFVVSALAVATWLSAAPLGGSAASAQEAIMLEQIGAVRMTLPEEVRRATGGQQPTHAQEQNQLPHESRG